MYNTCLEKIKNLDPKLIKCGLAGVQPRSGEEPQGGAGGGRGRAGVQHRPWSGVPAR